MQTEEIIEQLCVKEELLGYNRAIADCIQIIINHLQSHGEHPIARLIITNIGDDIVALKKTGN